MPPTARTTCPARDQQNRHQYIQSGDSIRHSPTPQKPRRMSDRHKSPDPQTNGHARQPCGPGPDIAMHTRGTRPVSLTRATPGLAIAVVLNAPCKITRTTSYRTNQRPRNMHAPDSQQHSALAHPPQFRRHAAPRIRSLTFRATPIPCVASNKGVPSVEAAHDTGFSPYKSLPLP